MTIHQNSKMFKSITGTLLLLSSLTHVSCITTKSKQTEEAAVPSKYASLPEPTGHFLIGMKKVYLVDSQRNDPYLEKINKKAPRELMVNIYYPVDRTTDKKEVPYLDDAMLKFFQREFKKDGLNPEALNPLNIKTHLKSDAPISRAKHKFPLIILSPGGGVVPEFYLTLTRELISHGFVVASINHTYMSQIAIFPDGSQKKFMFEEGSELRKMMKTNGEDNQNFLIKNNSDDIAQTLEGLKTVDLSEHIDFSKVGMLGHSLGGMAITYSCPNTSICRAAVNMDGPLYGGPSGILHAGKLSGNLNKPFLFLIGKFIAHSIPTKNDPSYKDKEVLEALNKLDPSLSPEEYYEFVKERREGRIHKAIKLMGKTAKLMVFEDAEHMAFSDWRLINSYLLKSNEKADLVQMMTQLNTIVREFFIKHLHQYSL